MEKENLKGNHNSSRIGMGLLVLAAGVLLLARQLGAPIPSWLFSWPVILIVVGCIIGLKSKFENPASFILILIGVVFLLDRNEIFDFKMFIIPVMLIIVGLSVILTPRRGKRLRRSLEGKQKPGVNADELQGDEKAPPPFGVPGNAYLDEEYLQLNAVLGGIKKRVLSKNFQGGEIVTFMGGVEVNFLNADLQHPVILEVNNIFGGSKLLIPSHWDVKNDVSAVFGGVDDKRNFVNVEVSPQKVIHLKGTCLFGGIEIANF